MSDHSTAELILEWARAFRAGELTADEIQDRFAAFDVGAHNLAPGLRKRVAEAKQELDAIRFGMCESGQRAEIGRIFLELEGLFIAEFGPENSDRELNRD